MAHFQSDFALFGGASSYAEGILYSEYILILKCPFKDYLREEKREVNHHGRIRTIGEGGEDLGDGELGGDDAMNIKQLIMF